MNMNILPTVYEAFLVVFLAVLSCAFFCYAVRDPWLARRLWLNDIGFEKKMKPCPRCGHPAITVFNRGWNDSGFFTVECGAYVHGHNGGMDDYLPEHYLKKWPELSDEQRKCRFCSGYDGKPRKFLTRWGAVRWWNKLVEKEKRQRAGSERGA